MMQFTDSHCHLDSETFSKQLPSVLTQCNNLSINRIIIPAISPKNFDSVLSLADKYHKKPIKLYPCLGIHPWFLDGLNDVDLECLATTVIKEKSRIVAIGETGIDVQIIHT